MYVNDTQKTIAPAADTKHKMFLIMLASLLTNYSFISDS